MQDLRAYLVGDPYDELMGALASSEATLANHPDDANIIVTSFGETADALAACVSTPSVEWIQLPTAGIEYFAASLAQRPAARWTSAKGAYAQPVAEHALALTLALLRELPTRVRARSWAPASGTSLHGLRVVVVGAGGVALEIVRLMKCFDTDVTVVRRQTEPVPTADRTVTADALLEVLPHADVLVIAAALTPGTRHLFDRAALDLLPGHAVLVNIARGGLIDTNALTEVLAAGSIAGAALDVTDPEPLPDGHALWEEPRALITPHAADTLAMIQPLYAARVGENLRRFRHGEPLVGVVDPVAGY